VLDYDDDFDDYYDDEDQEVPTNAHVTPIQGPIFLKNGSVPVVPLYSYPQINNGTFVQIPVSSPARFFFYVFFRILENHRDALREVASRRDAAIDAAIGAK